MTINNIGQKILIIGIIALLILGIIFLSIIPTINKTNGFIKLIIENNNQRTLITTAKNQTEELKKKIGEYEKGYSLESAYSMLIKKDQYKDFFNSIYALADKNSLECNLKYSGDSTKTDAKKSEEYIMVGVETKGSFNDSILFLKKLENYPYLLDILEYKISKQTDGKILSNYSLKVYANPQN